MSWGAVIVAGGAVAGGVISSRGLNKAADKAADAQREGAELGIEEQRLAREALEQRLQPFVDIGATASPELLGLMGLPTQQSDRLRELLNDEGSTTGPGGPNSIRRIEYVLNNWSERLKKDPGSGLAREKVAQYTRELDSAQKELAGLQESQQAMEQRRALPGLPTAIDPSQLPGSLDPSQLPAQASALDRSQLPAAGTAFGPDSFKNNPMLDFVLKEGFRGIREGAAGGGRVPDRDLVEFAQGTASTLLPALQAQQFGQQQALRGQAVGEQSQQFGQQQALRGQALSDMLGLRNQALGEQAQQFGQLGGLRESAIGEQQRSINNLLGLLGMGQSAAAGQGAAGLSTGSNISNLLGNIGTAQAAGALQKGQASQDLAGNITGLAGLLGGSLMNRPYQPYTRPTYSDGSVQMGPFDASGGF